MVTLTAKFDPVDYIREAKKTGFSQELAEFTAQTIEKIIIDISNNQDLVTKQDLLLTKQELQLEIAKLRNELIKWLAGTGVAEILAIAGLLKFMIH